MRYRSRTQQQQSFRPVVMVVSNSILPLWYLDKAHESRQPRFKLNTDNVEQDLDKAYTLCKKFARGLYKHVVWIVDVEPLMMVEQNKGIGRTETIMHLQRIVEEMNELPIVKMVINNPTYELWLQLHFESISMALETTSDAVQSKLQGFIPGYKREQSFYHDVENIYLKTQDKLGTAHIHANSLQTPDFPELRYARTMMPVVMSLLV